MRDLERSKYKFYYSEEIIEKWGKIKKKWNYKFLKCTIKISQFKLWWSDWLMKFFSFVWPLMVCKFFFYIHDLYRVVDS